MGVLNAKELAAVSGGTPATETSFAAATLSAAAMGLSATMHPAGGLIGALLGALTYLGLNHETTYSGEYGRNARNCPGPL